MVLTQEKNGVDFYCFFDSEINNVLEYESRRILEIQKEKC